MTKKRNTKREEERLRRLAQEYEEKGFHVILHPSSSDLPSFLGSYSPDMIASSDAENVVIDVRSTGTVSSSTSIPDLASELEGLDNWRYDLVLTNPRTPEVPSKSSDPLTLRQVNVRLESARILVKKQDLDGAVLLVWTALEALLRDLAKYEGVRLERLESVYIVKRLYTLGLLTLTEYRALLEFEKIRTAVVHGFEESDLTEAKVEKAQKLAKKFIKEINFYTQR